MQFSKICLALAMCCAVVMGQDRVYERQHAATLNKERKTIDAQFGGHEEANPENAKMVVLANQVNLLLKERQQRLSAKADGRTAVAGLGSDQVQAQQLTDNSVQAVDQEGNKVNAARNGDRVIAVNGADKANAALVREGEVVRGGSARQGGHNALMTNEMVNGEKTAHFSADRQYLADAAAISRTQWKAKTADNQNEESKGSYTADSQVLGTDNGNGNVGVLNKEGAAKYQYKYEQDGQGAANANLDQVGAGTGVFDRRTTGWRCNAVKDGESTCLDSNGKIVGKVMTNSKGDATVVDGNGVVIGRGKARKISDEQYEVVVSDGLAEAKTTRMQEYDCYSEVVPGGSQEHKITIENVKAMVDGKEIDENTKAFSWPTCFDVTADVTIPESVDPSRLAFEYLGHVMPLGNMKCMDSMTCGRGCYYCNACDKERLLLTPEQRLTTGDAASPVCDIHGGSGKQQVSMRVCPPAEVEKSAFCGGFDRHIVGNDYYNYDGSINAQVRVWLRPENEAELRTKFFTSITNSLGGSFFKSALMADYKLKNLENGFADPTDNELLEFYVKREGQEKLMACRRGVIDYQVGGSQVSSNLMIDAFANIGNENKLQLLSDQPCEEWKEQQNLEYAAYLKEHQESSGSSSGWLNILNRRLSL